MIQRQSVSRKKDFPVGLLLFLGVTIIFMVRFVKIALNNDFGGSHAYIQILNLGMPLVEGTYYDETAYEESIVTIDSLVKETLGIDNIDPTTILAAQIPGFGGFNEFVKNEVNVTPETNPTFVLNEESIKKQEKPTVKEVDQTGIRNPEIVKKLDQGNPKVLLYSSHTAEAFGQAKNFDDDPTKNVVAVTELIAKELEEYYGIAVIHDKTKHDVFYEQSYSRSKETLYKYKEQYGANQFNMVVDIHRDGVGRDKKHVVTENINGENVAKIMFVDTRNSPNFANTHAMNQRLMENSKKLFPGLARSVRTANNGRSQYNQEVLNNTTLIEVGAEPNTPAEAQATAKYIARLIAEEVHYKENNQ
ncbi:MAG: stage II sporulation protein P [Sarcina sp.]